MAEHDLRDVAFPKLDEAQIASVGHCAGATLKRFRVGEKLFETGARDFGFYVVKSGEVEIIDDSDDPPKRIAVIGPGEFTGDVAQLTGGPSLVTGRARTECESYEVSPAALRDMLNRFPNLADTILQAFIARRQLLSKSENFRGLRVIGSRHSRDTFRIRDFLAKNRVLFTWLDLETDPQVRDLLKQFGVSETDTPVVAWGRKLLLRNPSNRELADALGIHRPIEHTVYDLVVVGAGPAGLAAAVYGASEGLSTLVLERTGPGGQAGRSMRIENYLGFPMGITGGELAARAVLQANKFGALLSVPTPATGLSFENEHATLQLEGEQSVHARCLLIATGADYRRLDAEGCEQFEGCGVYYAATANEALMCQGSDVVVVGGGNSAGQAAVFLSENVHKVLLVVRAGDLYKDMSAYLARRIEETENIEVLLNTTVERMIGNDYLSAVELLNHKTGERRTVRTPAVFSFIGAVPRTDWLPPEIERDAKGFVKTGKALAGSPHWKSQREPFLLETTRAGVFAAGDVRLGSVKRVASAVGEGAMAVQFAHAYLNESEHGATGEPHNRADAAFPTDQPDPERKLVRG